MSLVVYGDFCSPLSFLASERADRIVARGVELEWRAVRVNQTADQRPVVGEVREALQREISEARGAAEPDELFDLSLPRMLPSGALAAAALAAAPASDVAPLRRSLFRALWREGFDLDDPGVVEELSSRPCDIGSQRVAHWQKLWGGIVDPRIPMVRLASGFIYRETAALDQLAQRASRLSRG